MSYTSATIKRITACLRFHDIAVELNFFFSFYAVIYDCVLDLKRKCRNVSFLKTQQNDSNKF